MLTGLVGVQVLATRHASVLEHASGAFAHAAAFGLRPTASDPADPDRDARAFARLVASRPEVDRAVAWTAGPESTPVLRFDTSGANVPQSASRAVAEVLRDGSGRQTGAEDGEPATHVPVRDAAGAVVGALSIWHATSATPGLPSALAAVVAAAVACGVGLYWLLGRPLRRIERAATAAAAATGGSPPTSLGEVARRIDRQLASDGIETRVDAVAKVRTHELETRLRHQEALVSNTAHELRTPLTAVMASLSMLQEGIVTDAEESRTVLRQAASACQHLLFLINDLVDSAAADVGRLRVDLQSCRIDEIGDAIHELIDPIAASRGIDFDVTRDTPSLFVRADRNRLMQVVFNLVGNALKFSPDGSRVALRIGEKDGNIRFEVLDRGIGVPLAQREGLFRRFSRVHDPASSSATGNGVGLYLCKTLVELMGGHIGYRSREDGNGSVFWFTLPKSAAAPAASVT